MRLECVIVCKDYADFLAHTLPENLQHFDRIVVVTHPADRETINICTKYSVDFVSTTCMHEDGDKFNKGRAVNLGFGHLRGEGWILHLDADIVLPHNFRQMLQRAKLHKDFIYGADRLNVHGCDHWLENKPRLTPHYAHRYFVEPHRAFPMGARIIHHEHGYTPIGYFQLFHSSLGKRYPINQGNAEHTDVLFACQWARQNRALLPEIIVYHLESESGAKMGANWNGRKTPRFEPKKRHHHHHHGHHQPHWCQHHGYSPCGCHPHHWKVNEPGEKK